MPKKPKNPKKAPKTTQPKVHKKRGRKPKGGKIIAKKKNTMATKKPDKPNIILHLKCSSSDIVGASSQTCCSFAPHSEGSQLQWESINTSSKKASAPTLKDEEEEEELIPNKQIWDKLKQLSKNLHLFRLKNLTVFGVHILLIHLPFTYQSRKEIIL